MLLAKTPQKRDDPQHEETLLGHSQNVVESFECMFGNAGNPTRLTEQWLRFFKLEGSEQFLVNGLAACILHDIGKANSGFQEAIKHPANTQVIRHEHLSGLLLWLPEIRQWLASVPDLDTEIVVSSVIGHHLRAKPDSFAKKLTPDRNRFQVYPDGIREVMEHFSSRLQADSPPEKCIEEYWSFREDNGAFYLGDLRKEVTRAMYHFRRRLHEDNQRYRLLRAVRTALIEADGVGSGLAREGKPIQTWIKEAFRDDLILDGCAVEDKVITPRVAQIQKRNPDLPFEWQTWQEDAGKLSERALLLAPCGSGKTLAAWRWIKARASERPVARVIFLYPTRGTANEGFRDYVAWAKTDAALIHGTAEYELIGMFGNPEDKRRGKDYTTEDRLFALSYWQRRIFSATVDQFLGFMQYSYRSTCLLPLFVDSVVVIDEIHSFDRSLFSALKLFLEHFDVPVLCMTASLSARRIVDMQECGLKVFPEDKEQFSDSQAFAEMPRYAVLKIANDNEARVVAAEAFEAGKKVLWVVNTVERCQNLARKLDDALCYHSRFKLDDRKQRHKEVVSAFQQEKNKALAITTQVCEMSLDLDADVLISESAPITSLIQRMGRCNRKPKSEKLGKVFVYQPDGMKPYREEELEGSVNFLQALDGKTVSQARLQELLEELGSGEVEVERYSAFLDSGPWAQAREESLRDIEEYTIQAVLDSEIDAYLKATAPQKPGFIVPVPRKFAERDSRLNRWLGKAKANHYLPKYGFFKTPVEEQP